MPQLAVDPGQHSRHQLGPLQGTGRMTRLDCAQFGTSEQAEQLQGLLPSRIDCAVGLVAWHQAGLAHGAQPRLVLLSYINNCMTWPPWLLLQVNSTAVFSSHGTRCSPPPGSTELGCQRSRLCHQGGSSAQPVVQRCPCWAPGTAPHLALLHWVSSSDAVSKPAGLAACEEAVCMRPSSEEAWRPGSRLARGSAFTNLGDSASLSTGRTGLGWALCCSHWDVNEAAPREAMLLLGVPTGRVCSSPDSKHVSTQSTETCHVQHRRGTATGLSQEALSSTLQSSIIVSMSGWTALPARQGIHTAAACVHL